MLPYTANTTSSCVPTVESEIESRAPRNSALKYQSLIKKKFDEGLSNDTVFFPGQDSSIIKDRNGQYLDLK